MLARLPRVAEQAPGAYVLLGATPRVGSTDPPPANHNHSPPTTSDEDSLPVAAALVASLAIDRPAEG